MAGEDGVMYRALMVGAAFSLSMLAVHASQPTTVETTLSPAAVPTASFEAPNLVGYSNSSLPGGSNFWFPSISIPTGIRGHVAQHITLSGDGGTCPPKPPLSPYCEQIMLTTDGGRTYTVVKKIGHGTSGNFNGGWLNTNSSLAPQPSFEARQRFRSF